MSAAGPAPVHREPLSQELVQELRDHALRELSESPAAEEALDAWERRYLGRQGQLARCRPRVGQAPPEHRPELGRRLAEATAELDRALRQRRAEAHGSGPADERPAQVIDPGQAPAQPLPYQPHPISRLTEEVAHYFARMGFTRRESDQIEDVAHSFDLLGVPADHPTRSPQLSYFTEDGTVLRGHTTASVLRLLGERTADGTSRFQVTGPCHRRTTPGPRFVTQFHQSEAVAVGPRVRLSDLKGLALGLCAEVLGDDVHARLRYRTLPYVSPGLAVDVACTPCGAAGCDLCLGSGHLEVLSGGMLSQAVLRAAGAAPGVRALSLAVSLERVLAIRHRVGDIRHFLDNDLGVLTQTY
ncbi:hypothetical protein [Streptacidiphilus sp. P02-A3a]|uniref:tRNA ligase subunit PheS family protein n=1 Tax=Streptacidiphilus sp. P02-A3a TaxID=2704468 RepID=UPI0015FD7F05|nr:hypothetical protein [Streptacidiphilus sp. P02-A3a]QMU67380.1 hypothetical protein GXP74_03280 [Streptacidiphilus sp. P02-A3a]